MEGTVPSLLIIIPSCKVVESPQFNYKVVNHLTWWHDYKKGVRGQTALYDKNKDKEK